ncbi:MAG: NUDIX domain-containing protein [Microthrixaceae bacterium]|nr:NUDIX domain-containing protein [Microthrixaceae bacterium]
MTFVLRRKAARVACFDPGGRILMIRAVDPADASKPPWWELPGGGIDPGETPEQTCLRELREEAGMAEAAMGPCIWTQRAQFRFGGWDFDQTERIHVAHSDGSTELDTKLEALEALAFRGMRWWEVEELLANDEPTVPPRLREFLAPIAAGDYPDPPIDISPPTPHL